MSDPSSYPSLGDRIGAWSVDPAHSGATFRCRTMWGLATVTGTFAELTGGCEVTEAGAAGEVRIPVGTLATGIRKRDAHLREPEFFDVEHHPEIVVDVSDARPQASGGFGLRATATVKGTTRPVEPQVTVDDGPGGAVRVTTSVVLDRHDFGVDGNLLGMVGGTVTVSADVLFVRSGRT
jgi:polyisoprenoid-binding protein YceI